MATPHWLATGYDLPVEVPHDESALPKGEDG